MYRDFTGRALLTFFLYLCGYIPGLVLNVIFLFLAWDDKDRYGVAPEGFGCLANLLIFCGFGPILALVVVYVGLHFLY